MATSSVVYASRLDAGFTSPYTSAHVLVCLANTTICAAEVGR